MDIGMMAAWNTDSGVSIHAELIGREWIKIGCNLSVFTFIKEDYHGECLTKSEDENYVYRCFGTSTNTNYLNPIPIITRKYDVFIVQDLRMIPYDKLRLIYPVLKKKTKILIHILHENHLPEEPWFYQIEWDAVVYFDERQKFIKKVYENAYYIPFPCAPWREGNQIMARKELGLPIDKKIVLIFAQRGYKPILPNDVNSDVIFLILCNSKSKVNNLKQCIIRVEDNLTWEKLDKYAFASDVIVLHKPGSKGAVVSSTAFQLIGTGRPILAPRNSDYFYPFGDAIIRYNDEADLGRILSKILENESEKVKILNKAKEFVEKRSAEKIARKYVELFKDLIS